MPAQRQFKPKKTVHFQITDAESVEEKEEKESSLPDRRKKTEKEKKKKPKRTVHFQTTDAGSVEAQGDAVFQLLGENKTIFGSSIEDYFEFGEPIYVDAAGTGKVLNAKRKVVENGNCQECVVKVRPKRGL